MKIIRLSTYLDFGGVETRLATVSHVQDENQWIFLCLNQEGKAAQTIKANKKKVINLSAKPSIYSISTFIKVYKEIKKQNPDVVHTSGAEANFHGIIAAKLAGVKTIIGEEIGIPNHSSKGKFIFSKVYQLANYVIGNSKPVIEAIHLQDAVPYSKLAQIANPILFKENVILKQNADSSSGFIILTVSRLEPVKNLEGLIKAVAQLIGEGFSQIRLTIAGSGTLEDDLKNLVKEVNLEKEVQFVGMIEDPYTYLHNADLYVLNSFTEGFSNSLVEAMYSKTPSLSTNVGAAPEIIKDGFNGFLIEADNELELTEKIKNIINLTEIERKNIGEVGYKTIIENYSLENHISELMKIYLK